MKHPITKLIATLRVEASAIGLHIARLPDGQQTPKVAAAEDTVRECITRLGAARTAHAAVPGRQNEDDIVE